MYIIYIHVIYIYNIYIITLDIYIIYITYSSQNPVPPELDLRGGRPLHLWIALIKPEGPFGPFGPFGWNPTCAIGSINFHYFHIIGDKLINPINSRGENIPI